ncbi:Odorant receptor 46a [Carabus blaptoides fortunei]
MTSAPNVTKPNPKDSFAIQIKTFWIIGLWYPEKDADSKWKYYLHSFIVLGLFYTSLLISQIVYMIQVWGDIEEMVAVMFLMVTIVGEYVKMYPFVCQPATVKSVLNELDVGYFQARSTKEEEILRRCMYIVLRNFLLFTSACAITCIIWSIYPVIDESSGSYTLPLKAWIPFDTNRSPQYQIAYMYLTIGVCLSAIINALIDTYITGLIIHAGAQLDILANRLENIKVEEEINSTMLEMNENNLFDSIVYCVKHHIAIIKMIGADEEYLHVKPRTCLSINITVLRVFGLWFPEEKQRTWRSHLYMLYAIFAQGGLYYLYMLSEIIAVIKAFGNIEKMTKASFLCTTHIAQTFKVYYLYKHFNKIVNLLNELDFDIFTPKNVKQTKILNWAMSRARSDSAILLIMGLLTCALWAIFPFIEKSTDHIPLPLSGWYPFDTHDYPNFQFVFCYQLIGATVNAITNISLDTTATGIFIHICAQIDILGNALENLKRDSIESLLKKKQEKNKSSINTAENSLMNVDKEHAEFTHDELEAEMINTFRNCVIHHEEIIRYAADIEEIFNMCFLAQFTASIIIICLTMFQISLMATFFSIEFVSLVLYQACIIFELLLYCWHGNEMILKSTALSDAIYYSEWYEFSPKFSRGIILLMARSSKPIRVTSGKFFLLSLSTFTAILRCSWSYFAVLNSMHEEKLNE